MRKGLSGQRMVGVFIAGVLLLNFPLLSLFDRPVTVFGLPLLHVYFFVTWAVLVVVAAVIVERGGR